MTRRRRSLVELVACAMLFATLFAQPALAGDKDKDTDKGKPGQGQQSAPGQAQQAPAPAPPAAAPAPPPAAPRGNAGENRGGGSGGGRSRGGESAPSPPAQAPASSGKGGGAKPAGPDGKRGGGSRGGSKRASPEQQGGAGRSRGGASRDRSEGKQGGGRKRGGADGADSSRRQSGGGRERGADGAASQGRQGGGRRGGSKRAGSPGKSAAKGRSRGGKSRAGDTKRSDGDAAGATRTPGTGASDGSSTPSSPSRSSTDAPAATPTLATVAAAVAAATAPQNEPSTSAQPPAVAVPGANGGLAPGAQDPGPAGEAANTAQQGAGPAGDPAAGIAGAGPQPPAVSRLPLAAPVFTPAAAGTGRLGVRRADGVTTSRPRATESGAERQGESSGFAQALENAAAVIPTWVWIALAVLCALVLLLGANTVFASARTRRLERQRSELMEDVGLLQEALLPAVPARMGALLTTVAYRPASGLAAGGDFYDAFELPGGRVGLLLGDVSGHGREALAKTALVRFTVRAHLEAGMSPREAISIAGRSLDDRLGDDFSTVVAALHDPSQGTLTYASAGHPPPLVLGPSAHEPLTAASALPVGVGFPTGQRQTVLPMPAGATVALYSDGLLEARVDGEPIGHDRLTAWLSELGPDATATQLLELVVQRADGVPDDLAAIVLHAAPGAVAPPVRIEQLKRDVLDTMGPNLDGFLQAAGVAPNERRRVGRRVSEQLGVSGGAMVQVRTGRRPEVDVVPLGTAGVTREGVPAR